MENKTSKDRYDRKNLGAFYTPPSLAAKITNESLDTWFQHQKRSKRRDLLQCLQNIKILDPSVGAGAFLLTAATWLENKRLELGEEIEQVERRIAIVKDSLFGVDLVEDAANSCRSELRKWTTSKKKVSTNIRTGNSLTTFDWRVEFAEIFARNNAGFDIILGNPPYGNILSEEERNFIINTYPFVVGGTRKGTWNSAAHFIVKSAMLLRDRGQLGFLIPNSILRVKQFTKTRQFLRDELKLSKIVDEGSPFDNVTLEMITVFCSKESPEDDDRIRVESRRPGYTHVGVIRYVNLKTSNIFSIYTDDIYERILRKGKKHLLTATRGRDIPKKHVRKKQTQYHKIPYITSGRSVRRYHIDKRYQSYTDSWYQKNQRTTESYSNNLLVATKNYKYPRCVIKPKGVIHGGGIVEITPRVKELSLTTIGLILNSRLVEYISRRYLTNYSQLTTCLNTGILEEIPLVIPKQQQIFDILFRALSELHVQTKTPKRDGCIEQLDNLSDTLVYELYFRDEYTLQNIVSSYVDSLKKKSTMINTLCELCKEEAISSQIKAIQDLEIVQDIEKRLENPNAKSRRY